jgi:hypothetical protein
MHVVFFPMGFVQQGWLEVMQIAFLLNTAQCILHLRKEPGWI